MPMFKKSLAVLLILVAAAIGGTMYGYYSEQETLALDAGTNMPPEPPRSVTVYVSGEVKKPGLVILPEGKRVADAVNEVGGVIETADIDRVNMAALLEDGMHIRVPENQKFGSKTAVPAGNDTDRADQHQHSKREGTAGASRHRSRDVGTYCGVS